MTGKPIKTADTVSPQQLQIYNDWSNRTYIEEITGSIKKIAEFLNSFGMH